MANSFFIRHLSFTGPHKPKAILKFDRGLNVIYGASDTGKSFVLEAIDFMFGGTEELRDIPERVGYDRIFLGIETLEKEKFTLLRPVDGGAFRAFVGLHEEYPDNLEGLDLALKRPSRTKKDNAKKNDNISAYLLSKIGLEQKSLRKNAQGDTEILSIRGLSHLCLINEGDIQKKSSPIESGDVIFKTKEYSIFKLLLSGVDDSALQPTEKNTVVQSRGAKLEIIEEMLTEYQKRVDNLGETPDTLNEQLETLETSIERQRDSLQESETVYRGLADQRSIQRRKLEFGLSRKTEIQEILARFYLLKEHYQSDILRLEGIFEAGVLVQSMQETMCPLCGAKPEHQHLGEDCAGNLESVKLAASKERDKILRLQVELDATIKQLKKEEAAFDKMLPGIEKDLFVLDGRITTISPSLTEKRSSYSELIEKKSSIRSSLMLWDQIEDLNTRKSNLQKTIELTSTGDGQVSGLSSSVVYKFSTKIESILKKWHFPDTQQVYFDELSKDLVISGKKRGARGKGMRAITHAAFTIGLLEYCRDNSLPHLGLTVLDTPLLAYREPENTEDDLRNTDVQDKFYEYLARWKDRQVIIIENEDPPEAIRKLPTSTFFTKNVDQGRYGLFPPVIES